MRKSKILKVALFATGLSGIVAEYVLSTLATYFLGDSVFQWTMIVSIMLFSMGLGSRVSKYISANLLQTFVYIEFVLSLLTGFVSEITYITSAFVGYTGFFIYTLSVAVGLLIGMEIPLVIRLNDEFEDLKINVSSVMEKDYYGSLVGGVFFAFIGLPYFGLTYTPFILGTINFLVALMVVGLLWSAMSKGMRMRLSVMSSLIVLLFLGGTLFAENVISYGEKERYRDKVVFSAQSKYQRVVITKSKEDFWLFINGNQQLSTVDEYMYHEPLVHPVMGMLKTPKDILVLGGGDGGAVREILKYPTVDKITLVDLDPLMTDLGQTNAMLVEMNQNALNHEKVTIKNMDGFNFLADTKEYYDAIIIDLPDPKSVELGRLYSYEFYKICYKKLRPNGVIITQAGSPYYAKRAFDCIDKTLMAAGFTTLPLHNQVVTLGEWGWVMGAKDIDKAQLKTIVQNINLDNIPTVWLNNEAMPLITSFGKQVFKFEEDSVEVNKIHNPVLYKYYLNGRWDIY